MAKNLLPKIIFVLGAPGAGKGTQCQKISREFGFIHLSAGELLRQEAKDPNSKYKSLIEEIMIQGKIVPSEITCLLLEEAIKKTYRKTVDEGTSKSMTQKYKSSQGTTPTNMNNEEFQTDKCNKGKFLIDGFPRNKENIDMFEDTIQNKVNLLFVLFFECRSDVCMQRCLQRNVDGSEKRIDDNEQSVRKRLETHTKDVEYILSYYTEKKLLKRVDANLPKEEVFEQVKVLFQDIKIIDDNFKIA